MKRAGREMDRYLKETESDCHEVESDGTETRGVARKMNRYRWETEGDRHEMKRDAREMKVVRGRLSRLPPKTRRPAPVERC